jgi:hypothetical protein
MNFYYEWREVMQSSYRNSEDNTVYYNASPRRTLVLHDEIVDTTRRYHVSFRAQITAGRHAMKEYNESFTSLETTKDLLLKLVHEHGAPQDVIDKICNDLKGF